MKHGEIRLIGAVLFDYGETLVRPRRRWREMRPKALHDAYRVMKRNGLDIGFDDFLLRNEAVFSGYLEMEARKNVDISDIVKYRKLVADLFPGRPADWREVVASRANEAFWKVIKHNYVLNRNARRALAMLSRMDVGMSVISNHHNPRALTDHLDQLRVSTYFSQIIASAQTKYRKPDSRIFRMCLRAMKVAPSNAVFVGDSMQNDIAGAKGAGLYAILMEGSTLEERTTKIEGVTPDYTVKDLAEVPRIVSRL